MKFLSKKSIGVDISDDTIEVVELVKYGGIIKILNQGRVTIGPGIVEHGRIKDEKSLSESIKRVFKKASLDPIEDKKIFFAIADSNVYEHIFNVESKMVGKNEIEDLISQEVEKFIPVKENDLMVDYRILGKKSGRADIMLTAIERAVILEWDSFFKSLDIEIEDIDVESSAIFRGLFAKPVKSLVAIVDIGANSTNVSVFDSRGLRYSHVINMAGDKFTADLASQMKIDPKKADSIKTKVGLGGKSKDILQASIAPLANNLLALLGYFEKKHGQKIKNILLVGGSSKIKGLPAYLADYLKVEVSLGQSIVSPGDKTFKYIEAIGLALRPVRSSKLIYGLSFDDIKRSNKSKKRKKAPAKKITTSQPNTETSVDRSSVNNKLLFQKIALTGIIVIGIILIALSFMYREYDRNNRTEAVAIQINI
jgi:type IV pilus assembly protein PilM